MEFLSEYRCFWQKTVTFAGYRVVHHRYLWRWRKTNDEARAQRLEVHATEWAVQTLPRALERSSVDKVTTAWRENHKSRERKAQNREEKTTTEGCGCPKRILSTDLMAISGRRKSRCSGMCDRRSGCRTNTLDEVVSPPQRKPWGMVHGYGLAASNSRGHYCVTVISR